MQLHGQQMELLRDDLATYRLHFSHLYALGPSSFSDAVKRLSASCTDLQSLISRDKPQNESKVLLLCWHSGQWTWLRSLPPKMCCTSVYGSCNEG